MITIGYVPDVFGRGIIIPIPKGGKKQKMIKLKITVGSPLVLLFQKFLRCAYLLA